MRIQTETDPAGNQVNINFIPSVVYIKSSAQNFDICAASMHDEPFAGPYVAIPM